MTPRLRYRLKNALHRARWRLGDLLRLAATRCDGGACIVLRRPANAVIDQPTLDKCVSLLTRKAAELLWHEVMAERAEMTLRVTRPELYEDETR